MHFSLVLRAIPKDIGSLCKDSNISVLRCDSLIFSLSSFVCLMVENRGEDRARGGEGRVSDEGGLDRVDSERE